ncbi:hypothetical protein ACWGBV_08725 [Streptomyces sp. NPDC055051]
MPARTHPTSLIPALLAVTLLATGCAGQGGPEPTSADASPSALPHGHVEGATEAAEQQPRLVLGDTERGDTRVLDLVTGAVHSTARRPGVTGLTTDGRFGYLHAADGTHVLDSGAWTVDHGDHAHHYRARIRDIGELPADPGTEAGANPDVRGDAGVTVVTGVGGTAGVHPRADLEKGMIGTPAELPGTFAAPVVPYAEHLIALTPDGDGPADVVVLDRSGRRVASLPQKCEDPSGDAVTRRGVVLGCADGALLVHEVDGTFAADRIPYGEDVPKARRATDFRHRAGSSVLTAPAGKTAVWVLDVTERAWTRVETGPVVAANTAGEGAPLLVLETDGALHGYDIAAGEETAVTAPLLTDLPEAGTGGTPVIEVDRSRAYVNDPEGRRVHEIDYSDDLRVARTFDLGIRPDLMVETGR